MLDDAISSLDDDRRLDALDERRPAPAWQVWLETAALAALAALAGIVADVAHPWLALAPLLAGLRYGATLGVVCAAAQAAVLVAAARSGLAVETPAAQAMLGWMIAGLVTGQFRDAWTRRARRLESGAGEARQRLGALSRAYHLLAASHEQLQRELPGSPSSLRDALEAFARQVADAGGIESLGGRILDLFRAHAAVRAATLHPVDDQGRAGPPTAVLGMSGAGAGGDDPLVGHAVRLGEVVSVRDVPEATGTLAAVPLVDVAGRVHAVVAVRELPFLFLHDETLTLLAVLGGRFGDLLGRGLARPEADRHPTRAFCASVSRALREARRYQIPAALAAIELDALAGDPRAPRLLARHLAAHRRITDEAEIIVDGADGGAATWRVLVLLRLAGPAGLASYLARVESLAHARADELGVPCHIRLRGWSLDEAPLPARPREIAAALETLLRSSASLSDPAPLRRHHGVLA